MSTDVKKGKPIILNPINRYYKKLANAGNDFDKMISEHKATEDIRKCGAYPTAMLPVVRNINFDPIRNIEVKYKLYLFIGYSSGHLLQVVFNDADMTEIYEVILINDKELSPRNYLSINQITYDSQTDNLFIGYGDMTSHREDINITPNWDEIQKGGRNWKKWVSLDFNNLFTEHINTRGGGIGRYTIFNKTWYRTKAGDLYLNHIDGQTSVLALRTFSVDMKDTKASYLLALWGPKKAPQTIKYGIEFGAEYGLPGPLAALPIPTWSGGDTPNPIESSYLLINTSDIIVSSDAKPIPFNTKDDNSSPTAFAYGNNNHSAAFFGYCDGRIERYNFTTRPLATLETIVDFKWAQVRRIIYSEFGRKEYLLCDLIDNTIQVLEFDDSSGKFKYHQEVRTPILRRGEGSDNIIHWRVSEDSTKVVYCLLNGNVYMYDFQNRQTYHLVGFGEDFCGIKSRISAISSAHYNKNEKTYNVFVAQYSGKIWHIKLHMDDKRVDQINLRAMDEYQIRINYSGSAPSASRDRIQFVGLAVSSMAAGMLQTLAGSVEYYCDDLEYDCETGSLFAYTAYQSGVILSPEDVFDTPWALRVGMGIDVYNVSSPNGWKNISPQKIYIVLGNVRQRSIEVVYDPNAIN